MKLLAVKRPDVSLCCGWFQNYSLDITWNSRHGRDTTWETKKRKKETLWQFLKLCVCPMIDQIMNVVNMLTAHIASEL